MTLDLVAIGNAMVDVIAQATDDFVKSQESSGMQKGAMTLIDAARMGELYGLMGPCVEMSGGSAGNTMAGFVSFGGRGAYIGKVATDKLGDIFSHDMKSMGVVYGTKRLEGGAPTGCCFILVTPDAQRTMNTYLGAGLSLGPEDVDRDLIARAQITYLEGYLFDPVHAKEAFRLAAKTAAEAGRKVALSLSDPFCVGRHRDDFLALAEGHVDILFANEAEIMSLYGCGTFEDAVGAVRGKCETAVLTRSEKGAVIVTAADTVEVAAVPGVRLVDTTGAGDQFAAGFLYGYTQGRDLAACGRLGALAAAEVISHMGPRPEMKYADLLVKAAA